MISDHLHLGREAAEQFETNRLLLRRYRATDAEAISEAIEQSRPALEEWTPEIASRHTPAEVVVGLTMLSSAWETRRKFVYGMFDKHSGRFLGESGLYTIDWERNLAEIGVWLRTDAYGRHLGREGFTELARQAALQLGFGTLEAHIHPQNERSRRLAESVGFHLHAAVPSVPVRDGNSREMLVYRLLSVGC